MPPFYKLIVASFSQRLASQSKWTIAVIITPSSGHSLLYQIVGSASNCSLDVPQSITLNKGNNGYMGKAPIGVIDSEKLHHLTPTLFSIPIVHGNPIWNSHNWVMEGVLALRKLDGCLIDQHVTLQWVSEQLGETA